MRTRTPLSSLLLLGTLSITTACSAGSSEPTPAGPPPAAAESSSPVHSVDPSRIKGLRIVSNSSEQRSCPFATSYPDVPGAEAMTAAMKRDVEQRLAAFREGACGTDAFITTFKDELKGREGFDATIFDGTLTAARWVRRPPEPSW
ncbi:hypothetical protein AB0M31_09555 [Streptomyces sp. NPDC051773]|uniref:hypothetical protein n=1 Tax=Streptomyces sp. NPDC051773 TaxID=3156682 RepID=UPI003413F3CF